MVIPYRRPPTETASALPPSDSALRTASLTASRHQLWKTTASRRSKDTGRPATSTSRLLRRKSTSLTATSWSKPSPSSQLTITPRITIKGSQKRAGTRYRFPNCHRSGTRIKQM